MDIKPVKAMKTAVVNLLPVSGPELLAINNRLNLTISISAFDKENTDFDHKGLVGYIAGDIEKINSDDPETPDLWFINLAFFNENYKLVD